MSGALIASTTEQVPVCVLIQHDTAEIVSEVILLRDPSIAYGTPGIAACDASSDSLAHSQRWEYCIGRDRTAGSAAALWGSTSGVIALVGLREGYAFDAPEHTGAELGVRLAARGVTDCRVRPGWLLSVRRLPDVPRCYSEPAALVCAPAVALPAVADVARSLAQERIVVADLDQDRTYALGRR
ncbi:hypothetical protein [Amycolatopsis lexingtonensis]|uniref:hypothetical protein n=1 Tax=Amycolatopsis lexingtonensis TaxID=218822 RepID=UPI003F70452E